MAPPVKVRVHVSVDLVVHLVFGSLVFYGIVGVGIRVGGGTVQNELGDGVVKVGGSFVAVNLQRHGVVADKDLYGGVYGIFGVPLNVEVFNEREEARAGDGEVAAVGRPLGIWGMASWHVRFTPPPMSDRSEICPAILDQLA